MKLERWLVVRVDGECRILKTRPTPHWNEMVFPIGIEIPGWGRVMPPIIIEIPEYVTGQYREIAAPAE